MRFFAVAALGLGFGLARAAPLVDYHQHLFSPETVAMSPALEPLGASDLIALLDSAGIARALVLSTAYQVGNPNKPKIADEYTRVRAENDWPVGRLRYSPAVFAGSAGLIR